MGEMYCLWLRIYETGVTTREKGARMVGKWMDTREGQMEEGSQKTSFTVWSCKQRKAKKTN